MPLTPGSRIGLYEIVSMLGAGGMGEVYRARDSKLKREVAIKVLPDVLAGDPDRLARFQREAELLATLNHPNIAAVYGLEDQAIVMELVEGDTLAQKIEGLRAKGSGLPLDEALAIARQIVDALEVAHDRGVIHRDLKPGNIKVTPDGTVKVLDFGLAKMLETDAQASSLSMSPTISLHATYAGVILGTAAYMSPEQARGKMVDRRTDIWAFGCVVFEMLTGKRTFDPDGDTVSDAVAAVLTKEPDWNALPPDTPPHIAALLHRCLRKDPRKRLPHIGVARLEIDEGPAGVPLAAGAAAASAAPLWRFALPVAVAVLLTAAVAGGAWWRFKPAAAPTAITRFTFSLPEGQAFTNGGRQVIVLSPDGTQIVYVANFRLYVRAMADVEARPIPGVEVGAAVANPVFSPDGASIAFYSGDNTIKRIATAGGSAITLGSFMNPTGMFWGPDGILVGQPNQGILRVSPNGGASEIVVKARDGEILYGPQMLPGGKVLLFTAAKARNGSSMNIWDKAQVVVQLPSGDRKTLVEGGSDARYLPSGHIVYAVGGVEFAVPFDARRLTIAGSPVPILQGVLRSAGAATPATQLSVAANGTVAYLPGPVALNGGGRELVVFDRQGTATPLKVPAANIQHPRVSPDGKRVVFIVEDDNESVVWTYELSGATAMRRLTFNGRSGFPIWSADGQHIAFQSDREGDAGIYWIRADATGVATRLTKAGKDVAHIPESWSPKGDGFLFRENKGGRNYLMFYSIKDTTAVPFGGVVAGAPTDAMFSPDGRWVVYESGELAGSVRAINVQPFPATGATYQLPVVGFGGYRHPSWSPDGREVFYIIGGTLRLMAAGVTTRPVFAFGNPVLLQKPGSWLDNFNDDSRQYDVLPDGQHFVARVVAGAISQAGAGTMQSQQIHVVLNWFEELKQRVPTK